MSPLVRNTVDSRARVLVVELLLCLVSQPLQLSILVRKFLVILELLLEVHVGVRRGARDSLTLLNCRAIVDRLPPLLQVRELAEVDAGKVCQIDPTVVRNVGNRVLVANEVGVVLELVVQDAEETFGLTNIALYDTKGGQYAGSNLNEWYHKG